MRLTAHSDLKKALAKRDPLDLLVMLEAGDYPGNLYMTDLPANLTIRSDGNNANFRGGNAGGVLKFERFRKLTLTGIVARDNESGPGFMFADGEGLNVNHCQGIGNKGSGLLTGNVSTVLVQLGEYSDSKEDHGVYCSQSGDDIKIVGVDARRNKRCAVQVNAHDRKRGDPRHDSKTNGLLIQGGIHEANQLGGGAADINLAAVYSFLIDGVTIRDHRGRNAIAMWDDATGNAEFACHSGTIQGVKFEFGPGRVQYCVSIGKGCDKINVGANIWANGVPHIEDQSNQHAGGDHLGTLAEAHEKEVAAKLANRKRRRG